MLTKLTTAGLALVLGVSGPGLAPAAVAAPAAPAQDGAAAVPAFNASGNYQLFQSRGGTTRVNVTQDRSGRLYGSASSSAGVGTIEQGEVEGTSISFTIGWSFGSRGRYVGSLGSDRRLSGTTFDLTNPSSHATWITDRTF
ncbi:hypothetical protein ACSNOI_16745 [Actinomadura kijaniata]|uniref:hypothetical protein n=1 Tax=Actinomadura kijaniata TaxID=46161 RepID=UPI003F1D4954